jgi:putative peptidoglycan lipid II flippase
MNASTPPDAPLPVESEPQRRSMVSRVLSATVAIFVAHLAAKLLGILQNRVIGGYYFGLESDAFVIAFEGILWTLFLVGEEAIGPAFLPVFMDAKARHSEERAWQFASIIMNAQMLLLTGVVLLLMLFPEQAITLFSRLDTESMDPKKAQAALLASHFLLGMAPALFGFSLGSLTYMLLNGYKQFFWAAFADAALKGGLVIGILVGHQYGWAEYSLIFGALLAGAAKLLVHVLALGSRWQFHRPTLDFSNPEVRAFVILVAPLVLGIVFAKVRDYYNNIYVLSHLEAGTLTVNSWGRKIYSTLGTLVPYPLSIAMFPFLCELVARDDRQALADFITRACRMLWMLFLPITAVVIVLSLPLAQLFFQTGRIGAEEALMMARVNAAYTVVLPFYVLEYIFMQAYFSTQKTLTVTLIGICFSTLSMLVSFYGVVLLGLRGVEAVLCVALGYSISRWLKTIVLWLVLRADGLEILPPREMAGFLLKSVLLAALCAGAAYGALQVVERVFPPPAAPSAQVNEKRAEEPQSTEPAPKEKTKPKPSGLRVALNALPRLALPGLAALVVFLAGCKLLKFGEWDDFWAFAWEKWRRRGQGRRDAAPADGSGET